MNDTVTRHAGERLAGLLPAIFAMLLSLLGLYIAGFGFFDETVLRVGVYAFAACFLILEAAKSRFAHGSTQRWRWLADAALLVCLAVSTQRYFAIGEELEIGLYSFTTWDVLVGLLGLAVLLVLTGRTFGLPLVVVCVLTIGYGLFGDYLPWIFQHGGYSLEQVTQVVWYSFDGVFGVPISVVVTLILVFVVFGGVLEGIGAGPVLLKFAFASTGRLTPRTQTDGGTLVI